MKLYQIDGWEGWIKEIEKYALLTLISKVFMITCKLSVKRLDRKRFVGILIYIDATKIPKSLNINTTRKCIMREASQSHDKHIALRKRMYQENIEQ